MQESFIHRSIENIESAELLFDSGKYNASANRAYYAAFHAALASIYSAGIIPIVDHRVVNSLFSEYYFNRRKILPSKYKGYLRELQNIRSEADYKAGIGRKIAKQQLKDAKEIVELILKVI